MNHRTLPDGSLIFPKRGDPPKFIPEGYERDPGDPFRLVLLMPVCKFRSQVPFVMRCGKIGLTYNCEKGKNVSYINCTECELRQE